MEQRTRDLNNPSTTEEHESFRFPIELLRSISSTNQTKRSSMHSNDSGITSPLASSQSQQFVELDIKVNNGTVALETIQVWTLIIQEE